ncbi:MAG TPA: bifunctional tRNA (5-methylaminomethyl-2-thiouridine)(34)-methyltransferase MnmD/FAD-dependent 5-carboxymethylaminomethyl-2-thiouridine(34) oxidoreductase MnmC [Burkholderiaceae bacterium]|nr:bifunctional tRNA (5-methylaminomethyl-2-thiouridine)(34)-methyltransferase MnmD/FAD-dependent 5-carboxymethylaminomethyl-2-thiouridine(34) oxidoreductase MnmC [Burkholderiaceae bacterium]
MTVEPARLTRDADGHPCSDRYGDVYASRDGALGQARHVFLGGNGLPDRWCGRGQFVVLETGFGLGTNFLATWDAWRRDGGRPGRLHFVSVERHPLAAGDLVAAAPPGLERLTCELARKWPLPLPGLHVLEFEDRRVRLTLAFGDARAVVPQLVVGADAIYLDGFAPGRNPEMWKPALLKAVGRCARPNATLATYTTAHAVRASLEAAGFELQVHTGFGRKREMLTGRYAPRWRVRRHEPPAAYAGARDAVVVGAGLAGSACASALARRGWSVRVFDSTREPGGASALPWGLLHPHFAVDDSVLSRLTRAGAAIAEAALHQTAPSGLVNTESVWRRSGVYLQASDEEELTRWRTAIERMGWPADYVRVLDPAGAAPLLGIVPRRGGLWWSAGLLVSAKRWTEALARSPGIERRQATVGSIEALGSDGWRVLGVDGATLAHAPVVIAAVALDTPRLLGAAMLPVQAVSGQVTLFDADELSELRAGLGGDGTLLRTPDGRLAVGATYEAATGAASAPLGERAAHQSNLERLARLLPFAVDARVVGGFAGTRCVARDRLPYIGAVADEQLAAAQAEALRGAHFEDLPRQRHLYTAFAFGSRGLTFAALAAERIAAAIEGEPAPIERDLIGALDPARVLLHRLRRGALRLPASDPAR